MSIHESTNNNNLDIVEFVHKNDVPVLNTAEKNSDYLQSQIEIIQNLDQQKCKANNLSKKSPYKLKQEQITDVKPAIGIAVIDQYNNTSLTSKLHVHVLAKRIISAGKKLGIIGEADCPMDPQVLLHATINNIVLDKNSYEEYRQDIHLLKPNSEYLKEVMNSKELKELVLVLDNWKFLPDGNMGLQFNCDPKQDIKLTHQDFLEMFKKDFATPNQEQKKRIYDSIIGQPNVYDKTNETITLTRMQFIRLKFALGGAQVKAFHPGTIMIVAWTKDADKLKNHENLHRFVNKVNDLVIPNIGISYTPDNVKEVANKERTMHPDYSVNSEKSGKFTKHLSKSDLLTRGQSF